MTTKEDVTMGRTRWTRVDGTFNTEGFAPPDDCRGEWTAYYEGPDGAEVVVTYWVKVYDVKSYNLGFLSGLGEFPVEDGRPVLYGLEVVTMTRCSNDPHGNNDDYEYESADPFWRWSLNDADELCRKMAERDESWMIQWDGSPR